MQLIFILLFGAGLGFMYGSFTDGFIFSTKICLFAGIVLIMPSLFKFELGDIRLVWVYKYILAKGFFINYVILPIFAVAIGLATNNFGITAGLFLISVLSGGGMVMHWIKISNADTSLGFLLLFVNLLFVSFSLFLLHIFAAYGTGYFDVSYDEEIRIDRFATAVLEFLVVIPFLASRVVRYVKPLLTWIETYRTAISQSGIFIIIFYLFGLQDSQLLREVYDFEPELFIVSFVAVAVFYLLTWGISSLMYDLNSPQERAAFWHSITRYLTLALVISTFSMSTFGVSMLLPIMFGYMVQIPLSAYIDKKYMLSMPEQP
jgi:hypothetical protein